jgi:glycosyltransferase involved in cell wall biosynthesis
MGHEVHLLCQDREAGSLDWVGGVGRWSDGELRVERTGRPSQVTAYLPAIGDLLPVYVADRYAGFRVKTFPELTDAEVEAYLEANVAAVRDVAESVGGVDAALANHLVMGPTILARAGLGFAAKIHGSALEYTVKPNSERFLPYAREGMAAAAGVLVGSRHTAESLWEAVGDSSLPAKTRLGPPGVDTDLFSPIPRDRAASSLRELAAQVRAQEPGAEAATGPSSWRRDVAQAAAAIEWLAAAEGPRIVFVGKLIVSKGPDLLLASWPLIHAQNPGARLLMVGFGEYEAGAKRLWSALETADLDAVRDVAAKGWALEGGPEAPLRMLQSFLDRLPSSYPAAAEAAADSVRFAGRLEHHEVARLFPATNALVFPSTFPESFGMVAAEAAAAGTLPVSAGHSGLAEVSRELSAALPSEAADLVSFQLDDGAVEAIAERVNRWLALDPAVRDRAREALAQTTARLWSWEGVARGVLAASEGRLEDLPPVPGD